MADFETACERLGVRLFVLPPRSPKLHGSVERANRAHTEAFHEVTDGDPELVPLRVALRDREDVWNRVRPPGSGLPDTGRVSRYARYPSVRV
jgi:hypothetical protein